MRTFVNPFVHTRKRGAKIRSKARVDTFPYNKFSLGEMSIVEDYSVINNGVGDVEIGNESMIGIGSVLIGPIQVGNNVILAQHIVASGLNHGYTDVEIPPSKQPVDCRKIVIDDNVWIGANAVITAGVTIGKHTVIGAGSVVTKSIDSYCIAVGNPARVIKKFSFELNKWLPVK